MKTFADILKFIRTESQITQEQLAEAMGVSTILISKIETDDKEVSKNFVKRLSTILEIHPTSLAPFLFSDIPHDTNQMSTVEKKLVELAENLQDKLLRQRAQNVWAYIKTIKQ